MDYEFAGAQFGAASFNVRLPLLLLHVVWNSAQGHACCRRYSFQGCRQKLLDSLLGASTFQLLKLCFLHCTTNEVDDHAAV